MRRFKIEVPVSDAGVPAAISGSGVSFMSEVVDLYEMNYSARRFDSRPVMSRCKDLREFDLTTNPYGIQWLLEYTDILVMDDIIDDASIEVLRQLSSNGSRVHVFPTADIDSALSFCSTVGATSLYTSTQADVAKIRTSGFSALGQPLQEVLTDIDVGVVYVDEVVDYSGASFAVTKISDAGNPWLVIALGSTTLPTDAIWARSMAINANVAGWDELSVQKGYDMLPSQKIYIGEALVSLDEDIRSHGGVEYTEWVFKTDIGTVRTDPMGSFWLVRNELTNVIEHGLSSTGDVMVSTSDDPARLAYIMPIPYRNDMTLDRYVRLFSSGSCTAELNIQLAGDSDKIVYSITRTMTDPLPEWDDWRMDETSLAFRVTNVLGEHISLFESAIDQIKNAVLQNFPATEVRGTGWTRWTGFDYYPSASEFIDGRGLPIPQASNVNEFMLASRQCYVLIDDAVVTSYEVAGSDQTNLWTPLDEWGLLLDLERHFGEGLSRYKTRLLDIFKHPIGSHQAALKYALIRELSPFGLDDDTFLTLET